MHTFTQENSRNKPWRFNHPFRFDRNAFRTSLWPVALLENAVEFLSSSTILQQPEHCSAMRVYSFLITFVILTTAAPTYLYYSSFGSISAAHVNLSFFLALNSLICIWEIALGLHITKIAEDYRLFHKKYGKDRTNAVIDLMTHDLSLSEAFSLRFWGRIWSIYSLYDPSYSNRESFGFFIDVGNGWTTLLPTLLFLYSITTRDTSLLNACTVGMIGLVKFYQELYGTCIYFLSFFFNKRYVGKSYFEVLLFVGFTNGIWFFYPLLGMFISYHMIKSNTFEIFSDY